MNGILWYNIVFLLKGTQKRTSPVFHCPSGTCIDFNCYGSVLLHFIQLLVYLGRWLLAICCNCSVLSFTAPKSEAAASSSNGLGGMIVILILLLLAATGFTFYFLYKKRRGRQTLTASFGNAIYRGNSDPGTHESNCLVTNIEENEQATV